MKTSFFILFCFLLSFGILAQGTVQPTKSCSCSDASTEYYAPKVDLVSPADGTTFSNQAPILLQAYAFDPDHDLNKVEFWINGVKVGEGYEASFSLSWIPPSCGSYTLLARASDIDGHVVCSLSHRIHINGEQCSANSVKTLTTL